MGPEEAGLLGMRVCTKEIRRKVGAKALSIAILIVGRGFGRFKAKYSLVCVVVGSSTHKQNYFGINACKICEHKINHQPTSGCEMHS